MLTGTECYCTAQPLCFLYNWLLRFSHLHVSCVSSKSTVHDWTNISTEISKKLVKSSWKQVQRTCKILSPTPLWWRRSRRAITWGEETKLPILPRARGSAPYWTLHPHRRKGRIHPPRKNWPKIHTITEQQASMRCQSFSYTFYIPTWHCWCCKYFTDGQGKYVSGRNRYLVASSKVRSFYFNHS